MHFLVTFKQKESFVKSFDTVKQIMKEYVFSWYYL